MGRPDCPLILAMRLGVQNTRQDNWEQLIDRKSNMASTNDASTAIQGLEKENKRFSGKRFPKVGRISEEVHYAEWPRGRSPRALWKMKTDRQETVEVYSVELYPEKVCGQSLRPA
jgi:hypothetical protein